MSEAISSLNKDDIITTDALNVVCAGPLEGKHPRVYLTMVDDADGQPFQVVCPYCSKVFQFKEA